MDRKFKSGASATPPTLDNASDGYVTAGNPGTGTPATKPGAHWYHMVTEEIVGAIVAAGITPDKTNVAQLAAAISALGGQQTPGGRLTLTTAVPVTTSDVTNATTVYYTPTVSDRVQIFNGTNFLTAQFTELSQALSDSTKSPAAAGNNTNYDMFVWSDGGTLRCTRGPAWSSDTARGLGAGTTELELFQGRYVNKVAITNGPAARRGLYVGSVRTNGSAQVRDSIAFRHCWNHYNAVPRHMFVTDAAANWVYTTNAYRQSNANTANQLDVFFGLVKEPAFVSAHSVCGHTVGGAVAANPGIGIDSTTVNSAQILQPATLAVASLSYVSTALYKGHPGLGRHAITWLERSDATGSTVWLGSSTFTYMQPGIIGELWA